MKAKNWTEENKSEFNQSNPAKENKNICSRTYNEEVPFAPVNFQTYQNILEKRNELLNTVKVNYNI